MKIYNVKTLIKVLGLFAVIFACNDNDGLSPELLRPRGTFIASVKNVASGGEVTFSDHSTNVPTSWEWILPGATPSSSTDKNPKVVYEEEGVYDVTMIVTNQYGQDTVFLENLIEVSKAELPSLIKLNFEDNLLNDGTTISSVPSTTGTPTYSTRTDGGGVYVFNGVDNPLVFDGYTGINGSNPRTISMWIKPEAAPADTGLMSWGVNAKGSRWSFKYRVGSGGLRIEWQGGGMNSIGGGLDDGNWHHVAVTFDGIEKVTLYIDGVADNSTTTGIIDTGSAGETNVELGSYRGSFYYKGEMDDVKLFDSALADGDILTLFED